MQSLIRHVLSLMLLFSILSAPTVRASDSLNWSKLSLQERLYLARGGNRVTYGPDGNVIKTEKLCPYNRETNRYFTHTTYPEYVQLLEMIMADKAEMRICPETESNE